MRNLKALVVLCAVLLSVAVAGAGTLPEPSERADVQRAGGAAWRVAGRR